MKFTTSLDGGGKVSIKSIIQAIHTYAMMCFLLPKSFCSELETFCNTQNLLSLSIRVSRFFRSSISNLLSILIPLFIF